MDRKGKKMEKKEIRNDEDEGFSIEKYVELENWLLTEDELFVDGDCR